MAMDLMKPCSTTVRKRRVPISIYVGTLATDDRDKELMTSWESMILRECYMMMMVDCQEDRCVMRPTWPF